MADAGFLARSHEAHDGSPKDLQMARPEVSHRASFVVLVPSCESIQGARKDWASASSMTRRESAPKPTESLRSSRRTTPDSAPGRAAGTVRNQADCHRT